MTPTQQALHKLAFLHPAVLECKMQLYSDKNMIPDIILTANLREPLRRFSERPSSEAGYNTLNVDGAEFDVYFSSTRSTFTYNSTVEEFIHKEN